MEPIRLKALLSEAEGRALRAREIVARQENLLADLERAGLGTDEAEGLLHSLIEAQQLHEATVTRILEELADCSPERQTPPPPANRGNGLLNALQHSDLTLMQPYLQNVRLRFRQRLQVARQKIELVHFLESGLASIVKRSSGGKRRTQVGLIGREGMTALPLAFRSERSTFDVVMEIEGEAQTIATENLLRLMDQSPSIRNAVLHYLMMVWTGIAQIALINADGSIIERLACLLLMAADRLDNDELHLTQMQISMMMSIRRPGVTVALQDLESLGLIERKRGVIVLVDREGLERTSNYLC